MYMCSFIAFFMKQINRLPPKVVKYFTDPNAIEPPDMQLLFPFVELCPGIWCPGGSTISRLDEMSPTKQNRAPEEAGRAFTRTLKRTREA
ncbi:hypothetical protein CsSME_00046249 [Camellia sinensis var. sinensis]